MLALAPSNFSNTLVALCICSMVPIEMRQCAHGDGEERPTFEMRGMNSFVSLGATSDAAGLLGLQ